jgi:NTE family protein
MADQKADGRKPGRALVLGGGGVTGVAWMTGLLLGLEEQGVDLTSADRVVGTSAGSVVGAQITTDTALSELYRRQVETGAGAPETAPRIRYVRLMLGLAPLLFVRNDVTKLRRVVGRMALRARTVEPRERRAIIEKRLPVHVWPETSLGILAIDVATGDLRCFERDSGASLVEAVGASCAVPGVWPVVRIQGRDFMDGGIPSADNASYGSGYETVVVVSPLGRTRKGSLSRRLRADVETLEAEGSRVLVITPSPAARVAIGRNPLDPANRPTAAEAGRSEAIEVVGEVRAHWA